MEGKKIKKGFNLKPLQFPDSSSTQNADSSSGGEASSICSLLPRWSQGTSGFQLITGKLSSKTKYLSQFISFRDKVLQTVKNQCSRTEISKCQRIYRSCGSGPYFVILDQKRLPHPECYTTKVEHKLHEQVCGRMWKTTLC